ncbi:MAG: helicase-exonuclease AddAB subunit AddA [Lachnospiraceae bacterium]|nr:helicase-exonuclease AddAB subunit AddA [Lachnospiraceae bacterium]
MSEFKLTPAQQDVVDARDCDVLVSAAAGSGKTAVLVKRIMGRITDKENPINIDDLMIVTFTNAAAAEMKERIEKALDALIDENANDQNLQKQAGYIRNAKITTIDGFCNQFLREHFYLIGFDPDFRIADEGEEKLIEEEVLDRVLNEFYEEDGDDFKKLLENYATDKTDERIVEFVNKLYKASDSQAFPFRFLDECLKNTTSTNVTKVEDLMLFDYFLKGVYKAPLTYAYQNVKKAVALSKEDDYLKKITEHAESIRDQIKMMLDANSFEEIAKACAAFDPGRLPTVKIDEEDEGLLALKTEAVGFLNEAKAVAKDIKAGYQGKDKESVLNEIKEQEYAIETLIKITKRFLEEMLKEKRARNVMTFSDLGYYTLSLLYDEKGNVTKLASEYGARFKEIMIDEYQDSNMRQEYIMQAFLKDNDNNLFMVGDVKQSIYSFRQAVPELFIKKYDSFSKDKKAKERLLVLDSNFRSRENILNFANGIFKHTMRKELGDIEYDEDAKLKYGATYYEPTKDELIPKVVLIDKEDAGDEAIGYEIKAIADEIRNIVGSLEVTDKETHELRPAKYSDIAILTRSKKLNVNVLQELSANNIPAVSIDGMGYFDAMEVRTVINILSLIDNTRNDIKIAAILTSPIIGLKHADLAEISSGSDRRSFFAKVKDYASHGKIKNIREKVNEFFDLINGLKKMAKILSVHDLIIKILEMTSYDKTVALMEHGDIRVKNLNMLIEKAKAYEESSFSGLNKFLRYIDLLAKYNIDTKQAMDTGDKGAVTLMSMHKSKGLEFPICIVLFLGKQFNDIDLNNSDIFIDPKGMVGLRAFDGEKRIKKDTFNFRVLRDKKKAESRAEELRILYVALTRARERLIITGSVKGARDYKNTFNKGFDDTKRLSANTLKGVKTYLDIILPALTKMDEGIDFAFEVVDINDDGVTTDKADFKPENDIKVLINDAVSTVNDADIEAIDKIYGTKERKVTDVKNKRKVSVSEIKHKFMELERRENTDTEYKEYVKEEPEDIMPEFLGGVEEGPNEGALLGTLTHRVMECLDFGSKMLENPSVDNIRLEVAKLVESGLVESEALEKVNFKRIEDFLRSDVGKIVSEASLKGRVKKEQPFVMAINPREVGYESDDEHILIQGIIDLFVITDDGIILLDYKTDKVHSDEELVKRYKVQLDLYKIAIEKQYEMPVKGIYAYSFCLGRNIAF